jgi:hypothetical protein
MNATRRAAVLTLALLALLALPHPSSAQAAYGTSTTSVLAVPAAAFGPSATLVRVAQSGQVAATIAGEHWWAPLELPSGTLVTGLTILGCATSNGGSSTQVTLRLDGFKPTDDPVNNPGVFVFASAALTAHGCTPVTATIDPPIAIDNNPANTDGYVYGLTLEFGSDLGDTQFLGAQLHYKLQVSPAPAVATFPNDVPTSHPFFRFVEALAAAGVTGGCGVGSFCPDAAVTRGQMAVFLSAALGLHYPD